jgi:hypothetical protein
MTKRIRGMYVEEFTAPGIVRVSAEALQYAHDFAATVGSRYVMTFDWAQKIGIRENANAPLKDLGACLLLTAFERADVPPEFIRRAEDLEFAIRIPTPIWQASAQRLIEVDESLPFRLALR